MRSYAFYMEQVEEEWLLYRRTSQKAIYLDQITSVIWQLCDGTRSSAEVAEAISDLYPDDAQTVTRDVLATLDALHSEGAVRTLLPH